MDQSWDKYALLNISDSVRASIGGKKALGPQVEELRNFLDMALTDEARKNPTLNFSIIEYARLDKLLSDILDYANSLTHSRLATELSLTFRRDISNVKSVQRAWRQRFREQYIMIDQNRGEKLVEDQLKDIVFNDTFTHDLGKWQTEIFSPISELEGNLEFEPGQYVLETHPLFHELY